MSCGREIPKLNKDNFQAWKELMNFHLKNISNLGLKYLENACKAPTRRLIIEEIAKKKNHNIMIIDITSALNYVGFDEVKGCATTHEM
jgi:hypothetical protein